MVLGVAKLRRETLTNIREFWIALAEKSRFLSDDALTTQIETIGRIHAKLDRDACGQSLAAARAVRLRKRKRLRHMTSITIASDAAAIPQQIRGSLRCELRGKPSLTARTRIENLVDVAPWLKWTHG
jgi:hypothetical protein